MSEVSLENLRKGIDAWRTRRGWPRDFHAGLYERQARDRVDGLTDHWWASTVEDLVDWRATRPLSKKTIFELGLPWVQALNSEWNRAEAAGLELGNARWPEIAEMFRIAKGIKGVASPVFASKLCHFARPNLYTVVDRALLGLPLTYRDYWEASSKGWTDSENIHEELQAVLGDAIGAVLSPAFPFATKITELCFIGSRS